MFCLQKNLYLVHFLSNFFKYSFSNFLLFHPNNIFVVYFSSNLLLFNTFVSEFNGFCFLIYTLLIFFHCIFLSSNQVLWFSSTSLLFNIYSTSYIFSLSVSTRKGRIFSCFSICFLL